MKVLPKKTDIDKAKADERKREIDEGIKLARSVDKLREAKVNEEESFRKWRENNLAQVQQEIDSLLEVKENLRIQTEEAERNRKKLLEPLDKEWKELRIAQEKIKEEKQEIYLSGERLTTREQEIENKEKKISEIVSRVTKNEQDTSKIKGETTSLKDLAQREYEIAREEHTTQTDIYEKGIQRIAEQEKSYEVALKTIEIRENEVKNKESELITREKDLARRQRNFQIAQEALKK